MHKLRRRPGESESREETKWYAGVSLVCHIEERVEKQTMLSLPLP